MSKTEAEKKVLVDAGNKAREITTKAKDKAKEIVENAEAKVKNIVETAETKAKDILDEAVNKASRMIAANEGGNNAEAEKAPQGPVAAKYLKGLEYTDLKLVKVKGDNGRDVTKSIVTKRPLTLNDVAAWRDAGDTIVIVANDGKKHIVEK